VYVLRIRFWALIIESETCGNFRRVSGSCGELVCFCRFGFVMIDYVQIVFDPRNPAPQPSLIESFIECVRMTPPSHRYPVFFTNYGTIRIRYCWAFLKETGIGMSPGERPMEISMQSSIGKPSYLLEHRDGEFRPLILIDDREDI
jgi:hypothetical protein